MRRNNNDLSFSLGSKVTREHWHLVAHRTELPNDRDYIRLEWPLGELVVCNDQGNIIAFDNVCPHRGTRFFIDDCGNSPITCPYHGWSYRGGRLRVSKPETFDPAEIAGVSMGTFQTAWCGDFLFVGVSPLVDLATQLGTTRDTLAAVSRDISARHDHNRFDWQSDWRIAIENALEPDHVPTIHPKSLGTLGLAKGVNEFVGLNSIWRTEVTNERMARSLKSLNRLFDLSYQYEGYMSIFVFPFAFVSSTFGYSYSMQNFFPSTQPNTTHFVSRLLLSRTTANSMPKATAAFFDSVAKMNRQVFDEDHRICQRISTNFDLDAANRAFSVGEEKVRHFRDSLGRAATQGER